MLHKLFVFVVAVVIMTAGPVMAGEFKIEIEQTPLIQGNQLNDFSEFYIDLMSMDADTNWQPLRNQINEMRNAFEPLRPIDVCVIVKHGLIKYNQYRDKHWNAYDMFYVELLALKYIGVDYPTTKADIAYACAVSELASRPGSSIEWGLQMLDTAVALDPDNPRYTRDSLESVLFRNGLENWARENTCENNNIAINSFHWWTRNLAGGNPYMVAIIPAYADNIPSKFINPERRLDQAAQDAIQLNPNYLSKSHYQGEFPEYDYIEMTSSDSLLLIRYYKIYIWFGNLLVLNPAYADSFPSRFVNFNAECGQSAGVADTLRMERFYQIYDQGTDPYDTVLGLSGPYANFYAEYWYNRGTYFQEDMTGDYPRLTYYAALMAYFNAYFTTDDAGIKSDIIRRVQDIKNSGQLIATLAKKFGVQPENKCQLVSVLSLGSELLGNGSVHGSVIEADLYQLEGKSCHDEGTDLYDDDKFFYRYVDNLHRLGKDSFNKGNLHEAVALFNTVVNWWDARIWRIPSEVAQHLRPRSL